MKELAEKMLVVLPQLNSYEKRTDCLSKAYVTLVRFFQKKHGMEIHVISSSEGYLAVPALENVRVVQAVHPADVEFVNRNVMLLDTPDILYQDAFDTAAGEIKLIRGQNVNQRQSESRSSPSVCEGDYIRRLITLRADAGWTLKNAADFMGIGVEEMRAYENGLRDISSERDKWSGYEAHLLNLPLTDPSEDNHGHIRTLTFLYAKDSAAGDLYVTAETKAVLLRQMLSANLVRWNTACGRQYEADCPVKSGMTLNIADENGNLVFSEKTYHTLWNGGGLADKAHPFSWETGK